MIFSGPSQARRRWVNFALWVGILLLVFAGERALATLLVAAALGAALLVAAWRALRPREARRPGRRPKSDLPHFNFENVKPSDFEKYD